jgi:uncharacterized protein (TIGR03435 family)
VRYTLVQSTNHLMSVVRRNGMKTIPSRLVVVATMGLFVISIGTLAQDMQLKFVAASIKSNKPSDTSFPGGGCHGVDTKMDTGGGLGAVAGLVFSQPALGRCSFNQIPLRDLVAGAFGVEITKRYERILGGPGWIDSDKYRIDAVAPNPSAVTEAQLKGMLQDMLADRFKLQIHKETRPLSGYALLVSSKGPKLEVGHGDDTQSGLDGRPGRIIAYNMSISSLAGVISLNVGQPVVDETGLTGRFNYKLVWTPGQTDVFFSRNPPPPEVLRQLAIDPNGPSIFTALQEQLGLRLEARKVPTEVFVIDSVQKPSEN